MTNNQRADIIKFIRGTHVKYYPGAGYNGHGKEEDCKFLTGQVLGSIRHTRRYLGPQIILVYFSSKNKSMRVKAYKLEKI